MIKRIKRWFKDQNAITRKTGGLAEKEAATQRKWEVAMAILNRREKDVPVEFERRKRTA